MWKVAPSYETMKITKVDEDNHKALVVGCCGRCGGSGDYVIPGIFIGTCFACNGTGKISKWVKAYTEDEFDKYVATQARAKERKAKKEADRLQALKDNSEENRIKKLAEFGYDVENPTIYMVMGENTYSIKDELKERGGRYNQVLNWYFTKETEIPEGYSLLSIKFDEVFDWYPMTQRFEIKESAKETVDRVKIAATPAPAGSFLGEIKERLRNLEVTLVSYKPIDTPYGTSILFTFKQEENILVWFTASPPDDELIAGQKYLLTGTVKKHDIYQNKKQTVLSRCIIKSF